MSNTQDQHPRGDAALLKAIATGSPVATNGKQEAELAGEWQFNGYTLKRNGIEAARFDMRDDIESLERIIASHASLHAYAKAHDLLDKLGKADAESVIAARQAYRDQLMSMGWSGSFLESLDFLATYRAAALAKAGGQ